MPTKNWKPILNTIISNYNTKFAPKISSLYGTLRHPTYRTVYHGSPTPFDVKKAWMGTVYDSGLHVGGNYNIARGFAEDGYVYKFMIPREKVSVPDFHANGINLLSDAFKWTSSDINTKDPVIMNKIKELGYTDRLQKNINYGDAFRSLNLNDDDKPIIISPRQLISRGISENQKRIFNLEADELYRQYQEADKAVRKPRVIYNRGPLSDQTMQDFNWKTADLLSKYGVKTLGYYNNNPFEGLEKCWMIMDPKVIYQPPKFELPTIKKQGGKLKRK